MEKYIKEQKELIEKMQDFFTNIDDKKKELEMQLVKKEAEQDDLLHEFELGRLNAIELMATAKRMVKIRKERRNIKDTLDIIKTEKGFADKFITKGICADLKQCILNLENLEKVWQDRSYHTKELKDLKISKKKENAEREAEMEVKQ